MKNTMNEKKFTNSLKILLISLLTILISPSGWSQASITSIGTSVTQNFDDLSTSGAWNDNSSLIGWYAKTDITPSIIEYFENDGSVTEPALYSFGLETDRALGYVPSDQFTGTSGVGKGYLGWRLKNNTGKSIGSIRVVWSGEQWRKAVDSNQQYITLSYQINTTLTNLTSGTYIATNSRFGSPINDQEAATYLDGNLPANRTSNISIDIPVNIPSGSEIMLRWEDLNDPASHILAIDDVSFTATKESQTITFDPLPDRTFGDAPFNLTSTSSSGLPVAYNSSNISVASISGNLLTITGAGTTTISASQAGNEIFAPAITIERVFNVKPQAPTALNASNMLSTSFTANWTVASGASAYYLYYSTDPSLNTYTAASVGNVLSFNITNLLPNTTYYYRLKSINTGIYSDYSNIISFKTSDGIQTFNISQSVNGFTTNTLTWEKGNLTSRILFMSEVDGAICPNPLDNTNYTAHSDWSNHTGTQPGSGFFCIYKGTGTSVTLTNLYPGRVYTVQAFEFTGGLSSAKFLTTVSGANNPITFSPWGTTTFTNSTGVTSAENWNTIARWDHAVVPTAALHPAVLVYIDGICEITSATECNNLTIKNRHGNVNPQLSISTDKSLNVIGLLTNNGLPSALVVKSAPNASNGSLTFGSGSPSATVEMYSKANWDLTRTTPGTKYAWQYFGIPVKTLSYSSAFSNCYVREWDESVTDYYKLWVQRNNGSSLTLGASSILTSGKGYELVQQYPKIYSFAGQLESSNLDKQMPYSTDAAYPGQHIFANPYTAAIEIEKIQFGANTEKSVYLYNTGTFADWSIGGGESAPGNGPGQYTVATPLAAGGNGVPSQIPSMQAFLVKATNSAGGSIFIPYSSALTPNTSQLRISQSINSTNKISTRIDITSARFSDRMWIFTNPTCTRKFDNGWDGPKMMGSNQITQLFSMEEDGNYQINGVSDMNNTYLGFQAGEDREFKLIFNHENIETEYAGVYLVDLEDNKTIDISINGSEYSFTSNPTTTVVKRFLIITKPNNNLTVNEEDLVKFFNNETSIFIQNFSNQSGDFILYNINGATQKRLVFDSNTITSIPTANLSKGVYIAKAIVGDKEISQRIIIR